MFQLLCPLQQVLAECNSIFLQESWYEKLNRWDEALEAYERKYRNAHGTAAYVDAALGRLR